MAKCRRDVLTDGFDAELARSLRRIREAITPYTRFVTSETTRLHAVGEEIGAVVKGRTRITSGDRFVAVRRPLIHPR